MGRDEGCIVWRLSIQIWGGHGIALFSNDVMNNEERKHVQATSRDYSILIDQVSKLHVTP
jgi:hypothetical protein